MHLRPDERHLPAPFAIATASDAVAIAALVNAAYRPTTGATGWTHERELVSGPRIDASGVLAATDAPDSVLLIARSSAGIFACVQLQQRGDLCLLGLLAVDPRVQAIGIGKRMLACAEVFAGHAWGCRTIRITVLSQRRELIAYYQRRGFQLTASGAAYPRQLNSGMPIIDGLRVDTMEKPVNKPNAGTD